MRIKQLCSKVILLRRLTSLYRTVAHDHSNCCTAPSGAFGGLSHVASICAHNRMVRAASYRPERNVCSGGHWCVYQRKRARRGSAIAAGQQCISHCVAAWRPACTAPREALRYVASECELLRRTQACGCCCTGACTLWYSASHERATTPRQPTRQQSRWLWPGGA